MKLRKEFKEESEQVMQPQVSEHVSESKKTQEIVSIEEYNKLKLMYNKSQDEVRVLKNKIVNLEGLLKAAIE